MKTSPYGLLSAAVVLISIATLASASALSVARSTAGDIEWTVEIDTALEKAAVDGRVIMVALGEVGDSRTDRHLKDLYRSKKVAPYAAEFLNVAAWSFALDEQDDAPDMGGMVPGHHVGNFEGVVGKWVRPNEGGVVALPQHLWLSAEGEVLLSCPVSYTHLTLPTKA